MKRPFVALCCCCFLFCRAQPVLPRFETIGVNEGLSQSSVYSVLQDRAGYMWFGTADGLNRYDGSELKVFKNKEKLSQSGSSNFIRGNLCEDKEGNIWFTTETGLYYVDHKTEMLKTAWIFPKQPAGIVYYDLVGIDDRQNLWLHNKGLGFVRRSCTTGIVQHFPYPFKMDASGFTTSKAVADGSGNIWFNLFAGDGLRRFNTITHRYEHFYKDRNFLYIFFGRRKNYFLTEQKIYCYDSLAARLDSMNLPFPLQPFSSILNCFEDSLGRLWLPGIIHGLFCFDFTQKRMDHYRYESAKEKSLPSDFVTVVTGDRSNNLWIGTDGGGVSRLDLKSSRFNLFPLSEDDYPFLKDYFIKCLYEDAKKRIWFGTNSNGFGIYDPVSRRIKMYQHQPDRPSGLPSSQVSAFFRDKNGRMWIGTSKAICLFDEERQRFTSIPLRFKARFNEGLPFVYRFFQSQNGALFAASSNGLLRIQKGNDSRFAALLEYCYNGNSPWVIDIVQTREMDLWLACPLNGLYHTKPGYGHESFAFQERFFPGIDIRSLHQDETDASILWIASGKGLICFDTRSRKFRLYNEDNGMANSYVYGILEDEKHNLWLSTNGGLCYFDRQHKTFQNYFAKDGLQSNEFNTGAFFKGASGTLYFGGIKGFNWFRQITPPLTHKPDVAITAITVDDQPYDKNISLSAVQTMVLPYDKNTLRFSFAVLDFTRPQANKIQYQLLGLDPQPVVSYDFRVRYPKLPPGSYNLVVKGANADGVWGTAKRIHIVIRAPFWERWWFYSLAGIVVLSAVVLLTRSVANRRLREKLQELEKQRAVEAERNRISKDMHDEIGSGLTHIALLSELIQAQHRAEQEIKKDVSTISQSARKLIESMSEIIWALNPQNDTLENLMAYLREQTCSYFEPFAVAYSLQFPDTVPPVKLSNEQRRNLFLVVKEALHNALKHAGASAISLRAEIKSGHLCFTVCDNGKGFDLTRTKVGSNGLRIMQRRMSEIGGMFEISTHAAGSFLQFTLPLAPAQTTGQRTTFFTFRAKHP